MVMSPGKKVDEKAGILNFDAAEFYKRGLSLSQEGCHEEALEALNFAIAKDPTHAEAYFLRGACFYALGRYDRAGDDIDAAAILGCRDAQFWSKHAIPPVAIRADNRQ